MSAVKDPTKMDRERLIAELEAAWDYIGELTSELYGANVEIDVLRHDLDEATKRAVEP